LERDAASHRLSEREKERATVQGFKYPWTHAWPDLVPLSRTLSGYNCLSRKNSTLKIFQKF
jgi:hypothetical protein